MLTLASQRNQKQYQSLVLAPQTTIHAETSIGFAGVKKQSFDVLYQKSQAVFESIVISAK
jgi:hypothetical protein